MGLKVEDLWKPGKREWDEDVLESILTPEDAELAKTIRLSRYASQDDLIWPYTTNSEYAAKSGYWVETHIVSK